jgi:hypothetical protein
MTMSDTRYIVIIEPDGDFDPDNYSSEQSMIDEVKEKTESGEWSAYGVGLGKETSVGDIEPDYGTFVWCCVTDAGYTGTYLGADKIQNQYLRGLAEEQISEYGAPEYEV